MIRYSAITIVSARSAVPRDSFGLTMNSGIAASAINIARSNGSLW